MSADDVLKLMDTLRDSVKIARRVRDTSPAEKDSAGRYRCFYCKQEIVDVEGRPHVAHLDNCPYLRAQKV